MKQDLTVTASTLLPGDVVVNHPIYVRPVVESVTPSALGTVAVKFVGERVARYATEEHPYDVEREVAAEPAR